MHNPLLKKIPKALDRKIRWRLFMAACSNFVTVQPRMLALVVAPVAILVFILVSSMASTVPDSNDREIVAAIREFQSAERVRAETGIYHTKRVITEGGDKPAFVVSVTGDEVTAPVRTDILETWQHNNNTLALIESNQTEHSLEAFLATDTGEKVTRRHFGTNDQNVIPARAPFDSAHDLASLYAEYASGGTPALPLLPITADFKELDSTGKYAYFSEAMSREITFEYVVDVETKQLRETIIYVFDRSGNRFEMSRIGYLSQEVLPAERFDSIFREDQFAFVEIS